MNQKVAVRMIEKPAFRVDVAANEQEAVQMVERFPYNLVLTDCQMPEIEGYEAAAEIRRIQSDNNSLPIIAMRADAMQGDREKCLAAGMDDYVSKPIKTVLLEEALERWLHSNDTEEQAA